MFLTRFFRARGHPSPERRLYEEIVAQARRPWLYADAGVPDTIDGRFDMIVLHAFLIFERMKREGAQARAFSQRVFDEMFRDMDRSLREMGVGDLSVGRRVRTMAEIFYGRAEAYGKALSAPEEGRAAALKRALARNVFADGRAGIQPEPLARYVLMQHEAVGRQPVSAILSGRSDFSDEPEGASHDA